MNRTREGIPCPDESELQGFSMEKRFESPYLRESDNDEVFEAPISPKPSAGRARGQAKRTAHLSGQIVPTLSGFEAVRLSFCDLVSEHVDGSKISYQRARRGYASVSVQEFGFVATIKWCKKSLLAIRNTSAALTFSISLPYLIS